MELAQDPGLDPTKLHDVARSFPTATVRRLGFLLARFDSNIASSRCGPCSPVSHESTIRRSTHGRRFAASATRPGT
jgi:hypothetical protein